MVSLLFVCTGNICRSPTAEGVMRHLLRTADLHHLHQVDSAAIHGYHTGDPPDRRTRQVAARHGVSLDDLRARTVSRSDGQRFDYILAMDKGHVSELKALLPADSHDRIRLFLEILGDPDRQEVADPYYGTMQDFEQAYRDVMDGCQAWLAQLRGDQPTR